MPTDGVNPRPFSAALNISIRLWLFVAVAAALLFSNPPTASGQSLAGLGALNGTVHDPSGTVVANASVEVVNSSIGIDRMLKSNGDGLFSAPSLPPAAGYSVVIVAPGFAVFKTQSIVVHVGEQLTLPIQFAVSSANQVVTVNESTVPNIDLTKTEVSTLIGQQQIASLPINGRRADQFALLTPGVTADATAGEVSFHGVPGGNLFLQDGVDITFQWTIQNAGGEALLSNLSMDAVQEFQTESLGYSAEFGRSAGGVINVLTKSGTNQFHGTAFWYFRNRTLNATDLFSKVNGKAYNPSESRHQFGGTVGGPVIKNKLFFFASYEGALRNFPLVNSLSNYSTIVNPATGQLLPGQCAATATQCANAQTYLNRISVPRSISRSFQQNAGFVKLDYRPSEKSSYTADFNLVNYTANHDGTSAASTTDGTGASGYNYNIGTHVRNGLFTNIYLLSSTMVNEARFGYNADRRSQGLSPDVTPTNGVTSNVNVAGIATLGASTNQIPNLQPTEKRFDLSDNFSQSAGSHQLKYGLDLAYLHAVEVAVYNGPGSFTYTNFTNFAYDLTPEPSDPVSATQASGRHYSTFAQALGHPITGINIRDYDFFVQDQWQATRALSLDLGLRYEYATFTQPPPPSYTATNPAVGPINQPKANFAPRVGFAYAMNNNTMLIRGSYGIFYNRLPGATIARMQQLGGIIRKSFTLSNNTPSQFAVMLPFPQVFTSLSQVNSLIKASSINSGFTIPNLATPYVQEWSLGVEHTLGRNMSVDAAYIASRGVKFIQRSDLNAGQPTGVDTYAIYGVNGQRTGTFRTPVYFNAANGNTTYSPNYGKILQIDNGGRLWYDGLIIEAHQRANKYIQSTLSYTYSHSEDLGQGTFSSNYYFSDQGNTYFNGSSIINGRSGYSYEKGSSLEDQRHRLVLTAILHAPDANASSAFARVALNGWELAPIFTYATPQYVDSYLTAGGLSASSLPAGIIPAGDITTGTDSRLYVPSPTLSGIGAETPGGSRVPFLPTANLPLGHTVQLDGRLTKRFSLPREQSIEFSFEAINALNHPHITGVQQTAYKSIWDATTRTGYIQAQRNVGVGSADNGFPDGTNVRRAQASFRYTF